MLKKTCLLIIIVLLFLTSVTFPSFAIDVPEYIKIGLRSGKSAVSTIQISSAKNIVLGYRSSDGFIDLYDFENDKKLYIRKDSYYINMNDYFFEYNYNSNQDANNHDITGPIHIQLGDAFSSKTEALEFAEVVSALGEEAYLALEGKWKVWVGTFTTYNKAEKHLDEMKSIFTDTNISIISKNSSRVQVTDDTGKILLIYNPAYSDYYFEPQENALIALDSKRFRGSMMFKNAKNGNLTVINRLKLDHYLYGVVPKEMTYNWPTEALKAQAVAARNYAIVNMKKHMSEDFNLCSSSHCQVYGGYSAEKASTNQAVDETVGMVLTYQGKPISTYYHSHSGGYTENSENVWGFNVGYLRGVEDKYVTPYNWEASFTKEQLSNALRARGYKIGTINNVYVSEYSSFGSVLKLVIEDDNDRVVLEKDDIRKVLGYNIIKSLKFKIGRDSELRVLGKNSSVKINDLVDTYIVNGNNEVIHQEKKQRYIFNGRELIQNERIHQDTQNQYHFSGSGYGHALGMSQQGAKAMAEAGYSFEEILKHYYSNVELVNAN